LGVGGGGVGVWGLGPTPQSPIPNPQSPIPNIILNYFLYYFKNKIINHLISLTLIKIKLKNKI